MKRIIVFILFLLAYNTNTFSQINEITDTLIFYDEVNFHSKLEEEAFMEYFLDDNKDFFKIFLAKDKNQTIEDYKSKKEQFDNYAESLINDKGITKSEKPKVKYYFNKIHDKYLVKYELNTFFPEVFQTGFYNCVTGTILYALLFDKLNIPYKIKVSPIHSYLVAYPQSSSIIVETTNPVKGYFSFNQTFKENYIKHLKDNKIISNQDYSSGTINELFEKFYFKEENVTLENMVGIQYYNEAIEQIQKQHFEDAFYNLEKAYLFYPSQDIAYLMYYAGAFAIQKNDYSELKHIDFLYKLARFKNFGITKDMIVGDFSRITQNQFLYQGNYTLYDSIYSRLTSKLADSIIINEIAFIYHYEKAKLYMRNSRTDEAMPHIGSAFNLRPEHLDVQTLFLYSLRNKFGKNRITEQKLQEFTEFVNNYPAIKSNAIYKSMIYEAYIELASSGYEDDNLAQAKKFQSLFHQSCINKQDYSDYDMGITRLYSSASVYYFRKGNLSKSKAMILEGLKYVPDSYELNHRLKTFK